MGATHLMKMTMTMKMMTRNPEMVETRIPGGGGGYGDGDANLAVSSSDPLPKAEAVVEQEVIDEQLLVMMSKATTKEEIAKVQNYIKPRLYFYYDNKLMPDKKLKKIDKDTKKAEKEVEKARIKAEEDKKKASEPKDFTLNIRDPSGENFVIRVPRQPPSRPFVKHCIPSITVHFQQRRLSKTCLSSTRVLICQITAGGLQSLKVEKMVGT